MKKTTIVILTLLLALQVCIPIHAIENRLLKYKEKTEDEIYSLLMKMSGHDVLEDLQYIEDQGGHEPIVFTVALCDSVDDFTEEELVEILESNTGRPAIQGTVVEMLRRKGYDFSKLLYLQESDNICTNTKQLLLFSCDIPIEALMTLVLEANDYRTVSAMQQLCYTDCNIGYKTALDLLFSNNLTYYQLGAANIGLDLYFQKSGGDITEKSRIISRLLSLYKTREDEQERFWIADSLGWCQDESLIRKVLSSDYLNDNDLATFLLGNRNLILKIVAERRHDDYDIVKSYIDNTGDLTVLKNMEGNEFFLTCQTKSKSLSSWSSYKGFAVYRNGAFCGYDYHAAIMKIDKVVNSGNVVIHAPGGSNSVCNATWSQFKSGNSFMGCGKPSVVYMSTAVQSSVVSKATALIGKAYTWVDQINDPLLNDGSKVETSNIYYIRCDGVVEYCFEYFGYKVGGGTSDWDISLNLNNNRYAHAGLQITPKKQIENLLYVVETTEANMY